MTDPLDRAKQLIALAVDSATAKEEARTTALIACQLIAKHGFVLVPKGSTPGSSPFPGAPARNPWEERVDPRTAGPPPPGRPAPAPQNGPAPGYQPRRAARRRTIPTLGRMPTPAMHNGHCPICHNHWRPGDVIAYKRGLRMTCMACKDIP